jgi:hypothetical protein
MRFIKTTPESIGEEAEFNEITKTQWWFDLGRPISESPGFISVETYADKDPNNFVKCAGMRNLFTDQAEYYHVCQSCYSFHARQQLSGSTRGGINWRERADRALQKHEETKGWCEFCDPIFGNGGWS